ncbi:MAG: hypothetical protein ACYCXB_01710 [Candidatus Humimicrobiaceae bacterium]
MNDNLLQWLLNSEPWIEYGTRTELMGQSENDPEVLDARKRMVRAPALGLIIEELKNWPGQVLSSHKSAKQPFHKISFIAELGFNAGDPGIDEIIRKMLEHISEDGIIKLPMNISKAYGGTGTDIWGWALCDAPINLYALVKIGLKDDLRIKKGTSNLIKLIRDNGWPCTVSKELGKFRGPGRKDDPCPYATLVMLKLLSQFPEYLDSSQARSGIDSLCSLWTDSNKSHPYIFYMGNDFRKLKAPLVWYDIIHVLDVISRFDYAQQKSQVKEMVDIVIARQDNDGKYIPESVWQDWKGWDFGQKSKPSLYLTFLVCRILERMGIDSF